VVLLLAHFSRTLAMGKRLWRRFQNQNATWCCSTSRCQAKSGLDILKQIKLLHPEIKILVLTMHPEDQYAMRVLKAGASGYLTKETASDEVVNALKKVLAGGTYVSAAFSQHLWANWPIRRQKLGTRRFPIASTRSCA